VTTLLNNFGGGTSGTTITAGNSGGASGNAFDTTGSGTGTTNTYDTTHVAHGTLAAKIASAGTAAPASDNWTTSAGSVAQAWFRLYLYFTAAPGATHRVYNATAAGGSVISVQIVSGTGQIRVTFGSSGTTAFNMATALPLNAWFRLEGFSIASATVGQVSLSIYTSMDSPAATETQTSAANLNTAASNPTTYSFGSSSSVANIGPLWMDDVGLSSTGYIWPAPASSPKVRYGSIVPSLVAAGVLP
jgi:hypothetical protein